MQKVRPKYLNVMQIKLPVTGVVSIFHRVSGILIILCIPLLLYLLHKSVQDESGFLWVNELIQSFGMKLVIVIILLALVHHLLTGIRFLLFDIDLGVTRDSARKISWFVLAVDVIVLLLMIGWII